MNNISLAQYDKKEWIVRTEKSNNYKIYNDKKRFRNGPTGNGQTLWFYDNGAKLNILHINYKHRGGGDFYTRSKSCYFLRVKNGRLYVYEKTPRGELRNRSNANVSNSFLTHLFKEKKKIYEKRANNVLINFLQRNNIIFDYSKDFAQNLLYACYPGTRGIILSSYALRPELSSFFANGDLKYVVKKCYGYDNKHLVKKIAEKIIKDKNLDCLYMGKILKKRIPVDFYYKLLDGEVGFYRSLYVSYNKQEVKEMINAARYVLKNYNAARIFRLLTCEDWGDHYCRDTFVLYNRYHDNPNFSLPNKPKSWREIHDHIVRLFPVRVTGSLPSYVYTNEPLPIRKNLEKINNSTLNNFRFEIPKDTDTLLQYSDIMSNCIRGYGHQVKEGYCDIIGVYKDNVLKYNISVSNKNIQQFYGPRNTVPEIEDHNLILDYLHENGVIRKQPKIEPTPVANYPVEINAQWFNQGVAQEEVVF